MSDCQAVPVLPQIHHVRFAHISVDFCHGQLMVFAPKEWSLISPHNKHLLLNLRYHLNQFISQPSMIFLNQTLKTPLVII